MRSWLIGRLDWRRGHFLVGMVAAAMVLPLHLHR